MYYCGREVFLSTKVKNSLRRCAEHVGLDITATLKDIIINGSKRGCSGFVVNNKNGSVVYLNTDRSIVSYLPPFMYRYADSIKDYTGYHNRFAVTLEELSGAVIEMLKFTPAEALDRRI